VRGDVVVVPFPLSATVGAKRRPALVLASWEFQESFDCLLCMITSQAADDPFIIELGAEDISGGSLNRRSYLRPTYLATADEDLIVRKIGTLVADRVDQAIDRIVSLLR
jgi:mRNA interferase MazF